MRIELLVAAAEPVSGTVVSSHDDGTSPTAPVGFHGWLDLLRALSDLLEIAPTPRQTVAAEARPDQGGGTCIEQA
jgi:hypothetical protein